MAKLSQVTFGYRRTHNLGDYNSITADVSATVTLEPGDDAADVAAVAWDFLKRNAKAQVLQAAGKKAEEVYLGLPPEVARTLRVKTLQDAADDDQSRWHEAEQVARLIHGENE